MTRPKPVEAPPPGWRVVRLGDVCEIQLGKMLSPAAKRGTRPRPYLRNINVQWGRFDLSDMAEMDFDLDEEEKFALRPGDLLVCEGGEPGRAAVWQGVINPCFYQKALHRLRPVRDAVDPAFVMYRLWLGAISEEFDQSHAKTTIAHLPAVRLAHLSIAVPAMHVQRRTVELLKEAFAAVERARAATHLRLAAAKALPPAYLRSAFDRARVGDWRETSLGDLLSLRKDIVHPRDMPRGRATFVGLEHIESGTGVRTGSMEVELADLTGRKPMFRKGDIVYGYLRPYLNKVWVADFDGLCSVDQYVFEVDSTHADPDFIATFMRSPSYLRQAPISTTPGQLPRIRTEEVASVRIGLPPIHDQRRLLSDLVGASAEVARLRQDAEGEMATVYALPAALLRQAFGGEL